MQFLSNGFTLFSLIGITQGLIMALAILSIKRGLKRSNRILALLMLTGAVAFGLIVLSHADPFFAALPFEVIEYALGFAAGPLLWFYLKSLSNPSGRFQYRDALHFLPFSMCLGLGILCSVGFATWDLDVVWMILHQMTYTVVALLYVLRLKSTSVGLVRNATRIGLLLGMFVVMHTAQLVRFFFSDMSVFDDIVPQLGALVFIIVGFIGYKYSALLTHRTPVLSNGGARTPGPSTEVPDKILHLIEAMEADRLYTDRDLTLSDLARHLSMSNHHLSQLLNDQLGRNFFDFVNHYRVEEAKQLLLDPAQTQLTIEGLAYEAGFKARSSFYAIFKKHVGMTPSEFKGLGGERLD
jgi:AraC-like DNA-binding protein